MFPISLQSSDDIINKVGVTRIIKLFAKNNNWHEIDIKTSNLGFGWIHYSLIRITKPKHVLVIGSKFGFIPSICAQACKDNKFGKVEFVDAGFNHTINNKFAWGGVGYWKENNPKKIFEVFGVEKFIETHIMTTQEFYRVYNPKTKWGYIYIDGDHSYKGVSWDFWHFWKDLIPGGFLSLHDICIHKRDGRVYGVWKLWLELRKKKTNSMFEFLGEYGLGIIQK